MSRPSAGVALTIDEEFDNWRLCAPGEKRYRIRVEYAKSGRSMCKACAEKIEVGTIRIGEPSAGRGMFNYWWHPKCFWITPSPETPEGIVDGPLDIAGGEVYGLSELKLNKEQLAELSAELHKTKPPAHLGLIDPNSDDFMKELKVQEARPRLPASAAMTLPLLPFQEEGHAWLMEREASHDGGGILCDEMGMGKTIQTIAMIVTDKLRRGGDVKTTLIVAPSSAMMQWSDEIIRCTKPGTLSVLVYHGGKQRNKLTPHDLCSVDVVLTSYPILEHDYRHAAEAQKVSCIYCSRRFQARNLRAHHKYFCGPTAQRTARLENTERSRAIANEKAMKSLKIKDEDEDEVETELRGPAVPTPNGIYLELMREAGRSASSMYTPMPKASAASAVASPRSARPVSSLWLSSSAGYFWRVAPKLWRSSHNFMRGGVSLKEVSSDEHQVVLNPVPFVSNCVIRLRSNERIQLSQDSGDHWTDWGTDVGDFLSSELPPERVGVARVDHGSVGSVVARTFGKTEVLGLVVGWVRAERGVSDQALWSVRHADGDVEDLDHDELTKSIEDLSKFKLTAALRPKKDLSDWFRGLDQPVVKTESTPTKREPEPKKVATPRSAVKPSPGNSASKRVRVIAVESSSSSSGEESEEDGTINLAPSSGSRPRRAAAVAASAKVLIVDDDSSTSSDSSDDTSDASSSSESSVEIIKPSAKKRRTSSSTPVKKSKSQAKTVSKTPKSRSAQKRRSSKEDSDSEFSAIDLSSSSSESSSEAEVSGDDDDDEKASDDDDDDDDSVEFVPGAHEKSSVAKFVPQTWSKESAPEAFVARFLPRVRKVRKPKAPSSNGKKGKKGASYSSSSSSEDENEEENIERDDRGRALPPGFALPGDVVDEDGVDLGRSLLHCIAYHRIVLDEAHKIKERTNSTAKSVFALRGYPSAAPSFWKETRLLEQDAEFEQNAKSPAPVKRTAAELRKLGVAPLRSAYVMFCEAKRPMLDVKAHPSLREQAAALSSAWKALPSDERRPFSDAADQDKARYEKDLQEALARAADEAESSSTPTPSAKKKRRLTASNKPPAAKSAFAFYRDETLATLANSSLTFGEKSKRVAEEWKALASDERARFESLAADDKRRYETELAEAEAKAEVAVTDVPSLTPASPLRAASPAVPSTPQESPKRKRGQDTLHDLQDVVVHDTCHRWALTGTPLMNRVGDLYSLIRFVRIYPFAYYFCRQPGCECVSLNWGFGWDAKYCSGCSHTPMSHYSYFNRNIGNPILRSGYMGQGKKAMVRLRDEILAKVMLRRTKVERKSDLNLPPLDIQVRRIELSPQERDFYTSLYMATVSKFDTFVQRGTVLNNFAHVFQLLSRLRQAVDHPYLVTHGPMVHRDTSNPNEDPDVEARLLLEASTAAAQSDVCGICGVDVDDLANLTLSACKHVFHADCIDAHIAKADEEGEQAGKAKGKAGAKPKKRNRKQLDEEEGEGENDDETKKSATCATCPVCFVPLTLASRLVGAQEEEDKATPCVVCMDALRGAALVPCGHTVMCYPCAVGLETRTCPVCRVKIEKVIRMETSSNGPESEAAAAGATTSTTTTATPSKRNPLFGRRSILQRLDTKKFAVSTKLQAVADVVREALEAKEDNKVIVFSQFTNFLDIVSWYLETRVFTKGDVSVVKLVGALNQSERRAVLNAFKTRRDVRVILMSLKAGGEGLNLQEATHVISTEAWWNLGVELQAFHRAHRIGQTRAVTAIRFATVGTIEERMLELQDKKSLMVGGAIEGDDAALAKLTVDDLRFLFAR